MHAAPPPLLYFLAFYYLGSAGCVLQPSAPCLPNDPSPTLEKFVDELPIPKTINVGAGVEIVLGAYKITQKLHRDLPSTTLYGFGTSQATATYPGPTLEAIRGIKSHVRWENHITDKKHILTIDRSLHWANPKDGAVPIVTHLHGGEVESSSDGYPDAWFTAFGEKGPQYKTQNYTYANSQYPTMLWYHDHVIGITRLNVFAGLLGLYIIRSPLHDEEKLKIPRDLYEIPLVVQDSKLHDNGTFKYPSIGSVPAVHPSWCPEFFGDVILVNGKVWPYLKVEARLYRFRILNGANARFFTLSFSNPRIKFVQIGTDGGYLDRPRTLSNITFSPAERLDMLIDFSSLKPGAHVLLQNSAAAPFPGVYPFLDNNNSTRVVMKFVVVTKTGNGESAAVPKSLPDRRVEIPISFDTLIRNLTLLEINNAANSTITTLIANRTWTDPVTETPREGSVEIWRIINLTPDAHPIHVHLIQFIVLDQQSFDTTSYSSGSCSLDLQYPEKGSCFTEFRRKPEPSQVGWKDTVAVWPGNVTRLALQFTTRDGMKFPFDATAEPGYLWHCHMLEHEDNDMMRKMKLLRGCPPKTYKQCSMN